MPDIIEENEGDGGNEIARRAEALMQAHAAARAAILQNRGNGAVAVPDGPPPAAAAADADSTLEVTHLAAHVARLCGVDCRPMFRRLGVRRIADIRYIREKDLDGLPRLSPIQKRKIWAVLKYSITDNPPLTTRTTLSEIARALNANKKKEKETASTAATKTTTSMTAVSTIVPMVQVAKLDPFDGSYSHWLLWKNKSRYSLAQTNLGALLQPGEEGLDHTNRHPGHDHLLFNLLAEAIVSGSAHHLIHKAEQQVPVPPPPAAEASANAGSPSVSSNHPSGRVLWYLLLEEYSQGPMSFWILSDARQVLSKLNLVGSISGGNHPSNGNYHHHPFITHSAHDYVNRFRAAKETLAEYQQALPDPFLASTFVEHVNDERYETIKKQLLHEISTKNLSLEDCIKELLMSDHILRVRQQNKDPNRASRKRTMPEEPEQLEDRKRLRVEDSAVGSDETLTEKPDEATSA